MLSQSPAFGLLSLALNNDHHFWGVVVADVEKRPTSDKLIEIEDWVSLPRALSDGNRSCDSEADDDDHMTLPSVLDMSPDVMSSALIPWMPQHPWMADAIEHPDSGAPLAQSQEGDSDPWLELLNDGRLPSTDDHGDSSLPSTVDQGIQSNVDGSRTRSRSRSRSRRR